MQLAYLVATIAAALANGYAAVLNFTGAQSVRDVAARVRVSTRWMIPFGSLLAAGALGLLLGIFWPAIGLLAATGLTVYFVCAIGAHVGARDRGVGGAILFLLLAVGALVTNLAR